MSSSFWVSDTSSSLSLQQKMRRLQPKQRSGRESKKSELISGKVKLSVFFSPHLKVEAGPSNVVKFSKGQRKKKDEWSTFDSLELIGSLTHSMKVWFQMGFSVWFFISVW